MTFTEALTAALAGSKVKREAWSNMGGSIAFVTIVRSVRVIDPSTGAVDVPAGNYPDTTGTLMRVTNTAGPSAYPLTLSDANATDWVIG